VTALHKKGYDFLIAEQARILHTVIEAIFDKYPVWQEEYGYEGKEKEILMPDIDNKNELNQASRASSFKSSLSTSSFSIISLVFSIFLKIPCHLSSNISMGRLRFFSTDQSNSLFLFRLRLKKSNIQSRPTSHKVFYFISLLHY